MEWMTIPCKAPKYKSYKVEAASLETEGDTMSRDHNYLIKVTHEISESIKKKIGIAHLTLSDNLHYSKLAIYDSTGMFVSLNEDYSAPHSAGIETCLKKYCEAVCSTLFNLENTSESEADW